MTTYSPDQLRLAVSNLIGTLPAKSSYVQVATDSWTVSAEPFASDLPPDDPAGARHLLYHTEITSVSPQRMGRDGLLSRALVEVWILCAIRTRGTTSDGRGARSASWDEALMAARHVWYALASIERHLGNVTALSEAGLTLYRLIPVSTEWAMGHVQIPLLFTDSLEA